MQNSVILRTIFLLLFNVMFNVLFAQTDFPWKIEVNNGEQLALKLRANPSTGFTWSAQDFPDGLLFIGNEFLVDPEDKTGIVGAGGFDFWRFKPIKPGTYVLEFAYKQPFNPADKGIQKKITIIVR